MTPRRSIALLLAASTVTAGGVLAGGQAAAKPRVAPDPACHDLLPGSAKYFADIDVAATAAAVTSGNGNEGVYLDGHGHTVQARYAKTSVGVFDAVSSLADDVDCSGASYLANLYRIDPETGAATLFRTVPGVVEAGDPNVTGDALVRFLTRVQGCAAVEMVALQGGEVVDVSPDREGTDPKPFELCPGGSGAGSMRG